MKDKLKPDGRTAVPSGQYPKRSPTDIVQFIKKSLEELSIPRNIEVSFSAALENPVVSIERDRIRMVFIDLGKNAIDAMPEGGRLSVTLHGDGEKATITIEDTGRGISKENMDWLFTPFFTTKAPGEGTGLGLSSAYAAVRMHQGQINITSNTDPKEGSVGTRVRITLPCGETAGPADTRIILHDD